MKVEELIIDGFKSYATRTVISDWDPQFNAITGLNGSGKSNILDAICFVLGISSMSTVRASNLQDLIYKRGQAGVTKASVTIVFDNSDKARAPIGFANSPMISVTRQVVLGGTSKYLINGHRAPQQSVLQLFQSVQLNINNPNFLIMQGKITKVLNMKPKEILSLIEEAAGTKMFEDRREKAERTMAKKETKLQENRSLLKEEIEPKLEKLKNEKRLFVDFQETQTDLENTVRVLNAYDYSNMRNKLSSVTEILQGSENRIDELHQLVAQTASEIANLNESLHEMQVQRQKEMNKNGKISQLEQKENDLLNEVSRTKTSLAICMENLNEGATKISALENSISKYDSQLSTKSKQLKVAEKEYKEAHEQVEVLKAEYTNMEELLSTLSTGVSSTGTNGGYNAQLINAQTKLNDTKVALQKSKMKVDLLQKEIKSNGPKLEKATQEYNANVARVEECKKHCNALKSQLSAYGYSSDSVKELKQREHTIQQELYALEKESQGLKKRLANLEFHYSKPSPNFDPQSVKGVAAQLFTLKEENFNSANALQVCAGGRFYNVVVDNEETASQLLERGKLQKRVTIIPLNKISARTLSNKTVQLAKEIAPGKVEMALNLIGYEKEVARAMEFIFGGSLVCHDAETAKRVTFHPHIRTRSITLQGDVYDPEGTLSGGSRSTSGSLLVDIQKYNCMNRKTKELQSQLEIITKNLFDQMKIYEKTKTLQNELNIALHKQSLAENTLESNEASQIIKRNEALELDIAKNKEQAVEYEKRVKQYEKEVVKITNDMEEFGKNKGSKLEELKKQIGKISEDIEKSSSLAEDRYDFYQNLQLETEQLSSEIASNLQSLEELQSLQQQLEEEEKTTKSRLKNLNSELETTQRDLNEERRRLMVIDDEMKDLESSLKLKTEQKETADLELQRLKHDSSKYKNNIDNLNSKLEILVKEHDWLQDDRLVRSIIEQTDVAKIEEYRSRSELLQKRFEEMRRKVNPNIMTMIESVEKKETALKTMIRTIEKDKVKIQETITKLNEYKRDTLLQTWQKVTKDFGHIFADLLPNSFAKLVPSEGDDITLGLEVKVKLGSIWKESLVELSGGQRSLIALSLIMALLQFRPAPMYILDEVDAALDLSHTQNIGHLIKTRFKGSQFIVVSLKEGMFSNANRVFRTRFQDGTSVVSVM